MHGTNTTSLFIFNFRREEVIKVEEIIDEIEIINPHGFVYCTTNMINGKKYIGQRKFYGNWKSYLGSGLLLTKAIKKYKRDNFTKEIIYIAYSKEELNLLEIEFIKLHSAVESEDYYNISHGGESIMAGLHLSKEVKQKMSLAKIGRSLSDETRIKMSLSHKGKIRSEETRQKISLANKGRKGRLGVRLSDETRKKMSLAYKEIKLNNIQLKEIRQKYKIGKYTQRELAKQYLVSLTTINRIINLQRGYKDIDKYKQ